MNRKLHNTILAFSVTGVMLVVGLMAAQPVLPMQDGLRAPDAPAVVAQAPFVVVAQAPSDDVRIALAEAAEAAPLATRDARSRLEADLADAESFEHVVAATAGFVAAVAAEAAVAGALGELDAEAAAEVEETRRRSEASRKRSGVRSAIAVPYFSFARGTGRGDRS